MSVCTVCSRSDCVGGRCLFDCGRCASILPCERHSFAPGWVVWLGQVLVLGLLGWAVLLLLLTGVRLLWPLGDLFWVGLGCVLGVGSVAAGWVRRRS